MSEATPDSTPTSTNQPSLPLDQTLQSDHSTHPESQPSEAGQPTENLRDPTPAGGSSGPMALPSVPGYEVLSELGRGGMGVVYKAQQTSLNRPVALKMIRDSAVAGPDQMARLRTEAAAAARLQHPHIVQVYDLYQHNGLPFYAMEYVPGGSLTQMIHRHPLPVRKAAEWLEQLARAVHYAHQQGIIHRDLKPANVLLTPDGTPKITDFGLAKQLDSQVAGVTPGSAVLGTPSYMAPEQATGRSKDIGPHTDVYALGTILYEMLTGRPPFEGETLMQTLDQVRFQEPAPPTQANPELPADLEAICLRCLAKEPHRRYPSAAALAEDLQRFLGGQSIAALQPRDTAEMVTIPGYEVWEELARGGLWVVYKARDVREKRLVALKRIRAGSPLDQQHLARLRATAEVARHLEQPNITAVYEVGGALTGLYLALEFIEGGTLQHKLGGRPLPDGDDSRVGLDTARLVELLARAVQHAHGRGLLHCHLQVANILLTAPGNRTELSAVEARLGIPKIIGFEMGRRREDIGGEEDLNDVRPTSYAMAPEQLFGRHEEVCPATDVYALGVILYECLTGQPPFRATTTSDLLLKVGFEILQPPRRVNPNVPGVLDRICLKCLQKDLHKRYSTAEALADDLKAFQDRGLTTVGHAKSVWERVYDWVRARVKRS
jgi:eukaryotic-like serine/threonine-protein kinase